QKRATTVKKLASVILTYASILERPPAGARARRGHPRRPPPDGGRRAAQQPRAECVASVVSPIGNRPTPQDREGGGMTVNGAVKAWTPLDQGRDVPRAAAYRVEKSDTAAPISYFVSPDLSSKALEINWRSFEYYPPLSRIKRYTEEHYQ